MTAVAATPETETAPLRWKREAGHSGPEYVADVFRISRGQGHSNRFDYDRFVVRHRGLRIGDFETLRNAKAYAEGWRRRRAILLAKIAAATGVEAIVLAQYENLSSKLAQRTRENGDGGRTYDVNQTTWSAQMHFANDVLVAAGYDRTALSEYRGFGYLSLRS